MVHTLGVASPTSPCLSLHKTTPTPTSLQGEFGPFQPNREAQVPLWLAHTLWKRKRCTIKAPAWMNVEHLDVRGREGEGEGGAAGSMEGEPGWHVRAGTTCLASG